MILIGTPGWQADKPNVSPAAGGYGRLWLRGDDCPEKGPVTPDESINCENLHEGLSSNGNDEERNGEENNCIKVQVEENEVMRSVGSYRRAAPI